MTHSRGTLYLVVGPSGAGKDSLIAGAKQALHGDGRFVFPRRYITRPADAGGEDHLPVSVEMFETLLSRGDILLDWHAHNLRYGVPVAVSEHLIHGRNVIVNVSRTVVDEARARLAPVEILYITVPDAVLEERLRARGRESKSDIKRRVARAREYMVTGEDVHVIENGGALDDGIKAFLQAIGAAGAG